jgi:hypothetical protein
MVEQAINCQHLTREGFVKLYEVVFDTPLSTVTLKQIKVAEKVRDKVIRGKIVSDKMMREALVDVIEYAETLNAELKVSAGFEPFGDLRGFKGRAKSLDDATSRLVLGPGLYLGLEFKSA